MRWAELASELVDRAASHVQSLPGTVTHQAKGRAVEQAKKDVGDARWIVCTRLPPSLQPDLLGASLPSRARWRSCEKRKKLGVCVMKKQVYWILERVDESSGGGGVGVARYSRAKRRSRCTKMSDLFVCYSSRTVLLALQRHA